MSEVATDESGIAQGPALGIPSPGHLLSSKRKEYGWSTKDVAHALHLSQRQVEAIEADDYAILPGKTYIMGYWRSYSQLLELPIEDSIQVHRANLNGDPGVFSLPSGHNQVQGMEERSRKRAAVLFGVLLAVFLVAVWYWQDPDASLATWIDNGMQQVAESTDEPAISPTTMPEPLAAVEPPLPEPAVDASVLALPEPNFAQNQESVEINTLGYEIVVVDAPLAIASLTYKLPEVVEVDNDTLGEAGTENSSDTQASVSPAPSANEASNASVVATDSTPEAEPEPAPAPPEAEVAAAPPAPEPEPEPAPAPAAVSSTTTGDNRIVFQVSKESWIDVRDSSGERLIYRTVNRGEDIRLAGVPPYSVFIGSAEGVSVQYQGRDVPFKVHESGLFARFEVGAQ